MKNARPTYARRIDMIKDIVDHKRSISDCAQRHGVSEPTVRKWLRRYLAHGITGLYDLSSRPHLSPRAIP
jgi:transposase-like protein